MTNSKTSKKATNTKAVSKKTATKKTASKTKSASKAKPIVKNTKAVKVQGKEQAAKNTKKRFFKCIMIDTDGNPICTGRYSGKKPKQAAGKACTRIFKQYEDDEIPEKIIFGMHECTRSSKKKKKYFYSGSRINLGDKPQTVPIKKVDPETGKNVVIKYYYSNDVKKLTNVTDYPEYQLLSNYDVKDKDIQEGGAKIKVAPKKKATKGTKKASKATKATKGKKAAAKKPIVKNESNVKVKKNTKQASKTKKATKATKTAKKN